MDIGQNHIHIRYGFPDIGKHVEMASRLGFRVIGEEKDNFYDIKKSLHHNMCRLFLLFLFNNPNYDR
jgi:hypothetical protein